MGSPVLDARLRTYAGRLHLLTCTGTYIQLLMWSTYVMLQSTAWPTSFRYSPWSGLSWETFGCIPDCDAR